MRRAPTTGPQVRIGTDSVHTRARIVHDRRPAHPGGSCGGDGGRRRRLPGRGRGRQHHHAGPRRLRYHRGRARRGPGCARVPDPHRRRWRLHHRPAGGAGGEAARGAHVRRDAGARQPRCEGAPDSIRRVREQVRRAASRAVDVRGRSGHPHRPRSRGQPHGAASHLRCRLQSRRGQDHRHGRTGSPGRGLLDPSARWRTRTSRST